MDRCVKCRAHDELRARDECRARDEHGAGDESKACGVKHRQTNTHN